MRSERTSRALLAGALLAALTAVAAAAASAAVAAAPAAATPAAEAFARAEEAILSGACAATNGWRFGVGRALARTPTAAGALACVSRATLEAKANLVCRVATDGIAWPAGTSPERRRELARLTAERLSVQATDLRGVEVVDSRVDTNAVRTVVVAVAEAAVGNVPRATYADVEKAFGRPVRQPFALPPDAVGHQNETIGF